MPNVLFANHLRLGSASSYRQAGFAKYLRMIGHDCSLISRANEMRSSTPSESGEKRSEQEKWDQYSKIYSWKEPLAQKFLSNRRVFSSASKVFSVVHVNRANPFTASVVASARSSNWKLVVDMEDWDGFGGYSTYAHRYGAAGGLLTFYEQWFPRTADAVIVVSHLLGDLMVRAGVPRRKIFLIPNGYDPDLFHNGVSGKETRKEYDLGDSPVVIYASTYWNFEKNLHETAFAAFKKIAEFVPDVKFLLVGSGNIAIKTMISEFGLGKNAIATGFVARDRVPQLMATADVAMHVISNHPFHCASSPMIIPEYMAVGKPIVAPRIGELGLMLEGGAGYLVGRPEPDLLADGVIKLLKDDALRSDLGTRAALRASEKYSYRVLAKNVKQTYEEIAA
ncbi:MAG: glycosyltransferase family 4 protein [Nitrososphaerales archaeon]